MRTLRLLLLAGFCLVVMASTAFGQQFTVEVLPSFTVMVETLVKTTGGDEYYVAVFKSASCGPCRDYERSGKLDRLMKRFGRSVVISIDEQPQFSQRVPAFWLIETDSRKVVKRWQGSTDVETIEREITRLKSTKIGATSTTKTVSITQQPSLFNRVGTSQGDMIRLHNQLHGGGSWTWPGDLQTHLRQAHGIN